jgi:hypothetical protein
MAIYFFTFRASPTPDAKEFDKSGGAFVNCWIRNDDADQAEERATELIYDYGWSVDSLEDAVPVTSADYVDDEENRELYEQSLVEGEVLVFNTWPRGEGDGEEE